MLRVASNQTLIVPPFECAWLSLADYSLHGSFCLHFDCQGENDVTIILKPVAGAKRWQHLQRQAGAEGALAVESNYTVILGSHRNSKLKIEKNGEERAAATGLAGCSAVSPAAFTSCWISYSTGTIAVGTGPAGGPLALSFLWQDPEPPIPDIQHVGLSCWDKHVSYRHVQLLPPLPVQGLLQEAAAATQAAAAATAQAQAHAAAYAPHDTQHTQAGPACGAAAHSKHGLQLQQQEAAAAAAVPPLLQLMQHCVVAHLQPHAVCHVLQLAEALLPRTQHLYEAAVALAGEWLRLLVAQHLGGLAMVPLDVLIDVLHEPLLDVSELDVFKAVAAWCQAGAGTAVSEEAAAAAPPPSVHDKLPCDDAAAAADGLPAAQASAQQQQQAPSVDAAAHVVELLQLVRFAFMSEQEQQAVLAHPFTQACPLVQQALQADLQCLQDCTNGAPGPAAHAGGSFQCQHRRLVLPAAVGAEAAAGGTGTTTTAADAADAAAQAPQPSSVVQAPHSGSSSYIISRRGAPGSAWPRRRLAPSCKELMFVFHGDRNGVIHHIATEYGTKPWVNPVLSKAVDIKASSPPSRHTDAKAIVSGQFLNTSFAGPRYVRPAAAAAAGSASLATAERADSTPSTWWQLDLGPQHRLLCNYYVMRHDGSHEGFVRSWVLQGSNDLHTWLDLRRHRGDSTIRLPGQYGSWPVTGPAASMPFRAFRLLLLEPTQSPTHPWAFCLSSMEFYGYFLRR